MADFNGNPEWFEELKKLYPVEPGSTSAVKKSLLSGSEPIMSATSSSSMDEDCILNALRETWATADGLADTKFSEGIEEAFPLISPEPIPSTTRVIVMNILPSESESLVKELIASGP